MSTVLCALCAVGPLTPSALAPVGPQEKIEYREAQSWSLSVHEIEYGNPKTSSLPKNLYHSFISRFAAMADQDDDNARNALVKASFDHACCLLKHHERDMLSKVKTLVGWHPEIVEMKDPNDRNTFLAEKAALNNAPLAVIEYLVKQHSNPARTCFWCVWHLLHHERTDLLHVIERLVALYPQIVELTNLDCTLLYKACRRNAPFAVINLLYQKNPGAVKDLADRTSFSPLHGACQAQAPVEVVRFLVKAYREACGLGTRQYSWTPIASACNNDAPIEVIRLLTEAWQAALLIVAIAADDTKEQLTLQDLCARRRRPQEVIHFIREATVNALRAFIQVCDIEENTGIPQAVIRHVKQQVPEAFTAAPSQVDLSQEQVCALLKNKEVQKVVQQEIVQSLINAIVRMGRVRRDVHQDPHDEEHEALLLFAVRDTPDALFLHLHKIPHVLIWKWQQEPRRNKLRWKKSRKSCRPSRATPKKSTASRAGLCNGGEQHSGLHVRSVLQKGTLCQFFKKARRVSG